MREERIMEYLKTQANGATTMQIADALQLQRTNVSSILNRLVQQGQVQKRNGKPMRFSLETATEQPQKPPKTEDVFGALVGAEQSLQDGVKKAKAAILYPPNGLMTLLVGPTGVGKTMFAGLMYRFAIQNNALPHKAPFVSFNCADYASNPQLLMAHLFGSVKGAYTGANEDRAGIVANANHGILFLDEVHRLPPEGQEMLFYLIDYQRYKPLGSINFIEGVDVRIIAATTELPEQAMLPTLLRRIPMRIQIPALDKRTLEERYSLILFFFNEEARKIGKEIIVTRTAMQHLLLYDCIGNIGQLKNDIQLGCANAFVTGINSGLSQISVDIVDFSAAVRQGALYYRTYQKELKQMLLDCVRFIFTGNAIQRELEGEKAIGDLDFGKAVQQKIDHYKQKNLSDTEMASLLATELTSIYQHFLKHVDALSGEEFAAMVDERLVQYVMAFVTSSAKVLRQAFSKAAVRALTLHVTQMVRRMEQGVYIRNYRLLETKNQHSKEYELCAEFAAMLEQMYHIRISIDEIAYLAFFVSPMELNTEVHPAILILMHGESSAQSMANVAGRLMGATHVYAYDMSLSIPTKTAYQQVHAMLENVDLSCGLLLLVDMGSLKVFGEMLSSDLGITVRVLDMVSTALVLECARISLLVNHVEEVYEQVRSDLEQYHEIANFDTRAFEEPSARQVIVTMCMTGEGSALKLKNLVESKLGMSEESAVQVVPCAVYSRDEMLIRINRLLQSNEVLCVIGTINPQIESIPFIHISELVIDKDFARLRQITKHKQLGEEIPVEQDRHIMQIYNELYHFLSEEVTNVDVNLLQKHMLPFLRTLSPLGYQEHWEQNVGLICHIACLIEKLILKQPTRDCPDLVLLRETYTKQFDFLRQQIQPIEQDFQIKMRDDDIAFILKILMHI